MLIKQLTGSGDGDTSGIRTQKVLGPVAYTYNSHCGWVLAKLLWTVRALADRRLRTGHFVTMPMAQGDRFHQVGFSIE